MRKQQVNIRLTETEYQELKEKAEDYGLTLSRFLRDLGMNYPMTCIVDQKAVHSFLKVAGDLGRLGGLFKHWLAQNEETKINLSEKYSYEDIDNIIDEILDLQILLKQEALKVMNYDSKKSPVQKSN